MTPKDVYPLPRIDETLEQLGGARRFSTLDLKAGYWQIGVAPRDQDKTAFVTRRGLFRFKRMPFGLSNAPATFQRMMDCLLRGLTWLCCLVYLDDIIVYSPGGPGRHAVEMAVVLERLSQAGLTLKPSKCVVAATIIEYLGHELRADGVRPVDRLVTSVSEFPRPTDATAVKRFAHLAGYYRRFVAGFGERMAPLTKLLRKCEPWRWGAEQEQAFTWIKAKLSTKPVLVYPDFRLPFVLATDASLVGVGAALMQDQGQGLQPVAFASSANTPAQAKYGISELECLGVVWAVKTFRPYLYGRKFTIITDHSALKWLMTHKNPSGRLHRWALSLQEFDFVMVHRPGKENVVPDALSRAPVRQVVARQQITNDVLRREQAKSKICQDLQARRQYQGELVQVVDGVLYRGRGDDKRVVLPASLWATILREHHDSVWAGHLRGAQTFERIQRRYWWPQMRASVEQWVQSCRDCGSRKAPQRSRSCRRCAVWPAVPWVSAGDSTSPRRCPFHRGGTDTWGSWSST